MYGSCFRCFYSSGNAQFSSDCTYMCSWYIYICNCKINQPNTLSYWIYAPVMTKSCTSCDSLITTYATGSDCYAYSYLRYYKWGTPSIHTYEAQSWSSWVMICTNTWHHIVHTGTCMYINWCCYTSRCSTPTQCWAIKVAIGASKPTCWEHNIYIWDMIIENGTWSKSQITQYYNNSKARFNVG